MLAAKDPFGEPMKTFIIPPRGGRVAASSVGNEAAEIRAGAGGCQHEHDDGCY
jgi:hypothetical protein